MFCDNRWRALCAVCLSLFRPEVIGLLSRRFAALRNKTGQKFLYFSYVILSVCVFLLGIDTPLGLGSFANGCYVVFSLAFAFVIVFALGFQASSQGCPWQAGAVAWLSPLSGVGFRT